MSLPQLIENLKRFFRPTDVERKNLQSLFGQSSVIVSTMKGPEHVFDYVNPAHVRLLGGVNATGKTVLQVQPEAKGTILPLLDRVYKLGETVKLSDSDFLIGSENRSFDFIFVPSRDKNGKIDGVMALVNDITAIKRAEKQLLIERSELKRTQEQLNLALASAQMGTWHIDLKTQIVTTSESFAAIFGVPKVEGNIFEEIARYMHPEDRNEINRVWLNAVEKRMLYQHEYRIVWPDGTIRWVNSRGTVKLDQNGEPAHFSGVLSDTTDRKRSENQQAEHRKVQDKTQNNLTKLFENSTGFLAIMGGPKHVYEYVNPGHVKVVGSDLRGRAFLEALPEATELSSVLDTVYRTGVSVANHELPVKISGVTHYMDANYVARRNDSEDIDGVMAWGVDITEQVLIRKRIEEEREVRERFVDTLTHDLRTPLTSVKTGAQLIERKSEDPDFVRKVARRVITSVDRADRMILDLLDANRIKAGEGIPIKVEAVDLVSLTHSVTEELKEIYGPRISYKSDPANIQGQWDQTAMRRVIENLVTNAIKYGDEKSEVSVNLTQIGMRVKIAVHNWGNPILDEDQKRIFTAYRRSETAIKGRQKGWGIGLTLVKGITEAHGGSVQVESGPSIGTTFTIDIPLISL